MVKQPRFKKIQYISQKLNFYTTIFITSVTTKKLSFIMENIGKTR